MGYCVYLGIFVIALMGCSSNTSRDTVKFPQFSYIDGLRTAATVSCSSQTPVDCMACALQGEAADQPAKGIYAVGITIMTRAKGDLQKVCKVTKARRQFEGMRKKGKRKISHKVWNLSKRIIASKETGWTHFYAPTTQTHLKRKKPQWANSFEKRKCTREKIGDHVFYNTNQCHLDRYYRVNAQND